MTDPISNERLVEMLAGLEGVTPGPWRAYRHPQHAGQIQIGAGEIDGDGWDEWCVAATFEASEPGDLDANHIARCDPDTIRSLIEEVQASRRQSPGVEVKPLEWNGVIASTPFCTYSVGDYGDDSEDWRYVRSEYPYGERSEDGYPTEAEVKAAAQADYERRILSCLSVEPAGVEGGRNV